MASASDLQQQALTFYETHEGSLLSASNSLSLIVHDASNSPTWLVSGIIQQALSETNECYLSPQAPTLRKIANTTYVYSFTNPEHLYNRYFNRYLTKNRELLKFTSFLSDFTSNLENWDTYILNQIKENTLQRPIVIIEHPELLISIIPGMTINKLISKLTEFQKFSTLYIVTSTSLTKSYQTLLPSLLHRSSLIISLTSLSTGRADDISGILSVSSGPKFMSSNPKISDRQYSYYVSTNSVKLYFK